MITSSTLIGLDSYRPEAVRDRPHKIRLRFLPIASSKPVSTQSPLLADDRPDVIVERLKHIMRVAADIIFVRSAVVMAVVDGEDFVCFLVAHDDLRRPPDLTSTPAHCSTG